MLKTTGKWINSTHYIVTVEKGKHTSLSVFCLLCVTRFLYECGWYVWLACWYFFFLFACCQSTITMEFYVIVGACGLKDAIENEHSYSFYTPGVAINEALPAAGKGSPLVKKCHRGGDIHYCTVTFSSHVTHSATACRALLMSSIIISHCISSTLTLGYLTFHPVFFVSFDQFVNPKNVLSVIKCYVNNR